MFFAEFYKINLLTNIELIYLRSAATEFQLKTLASQLIFSSCSCSLDILVMLT